MRGDERECSVALIAVRGLQPDVFRLDSPERLVGCAERIVLHFQGSIVGLDFLEMLQAGLVVFPSRIQLGAFLQKRRDDSEKAALEALVRYAVIEVAGSLDASVVIDAGVPSA